ncbi:hypothetical protein GCM10008986_30120 [Salinibacillus aidingensis]|uniref:FadR C-terminal domain-containing protein n=1 Tax=Salinibacillus aidingensis TaxID=237684 RepID=A0ABN1BLW8_9BACI
MDKIATWPPCYVKDYWKEGNIKTIVDIVQQYEEVPDEFVLYFLELRNAITTKYIKEAVMNHYPKVVAILSEMDTLHDQAEDFALFDWHLQKRVAGLSHNPIYLLMLNSFDHVYVRMATKYFSLDFCRKASFNYYKDLMTAALNGDYQQAESAVSSMMEKSYTIWKNHISSDYKEGEDTIR